MPNHERSEKKKEKNKKAVVSTLFAMEKRRVKIYFVFQWRNVFVAIGVKLNIKINKKCF